MQTFDLTSYKNGYKRVQRAESQHVYLHARFGVIIKRCGVFLKQLQLVYLGFEVTTRVELEAELCEEKQLCAENDKKKTDRLQRVQNTVCSRQREAVMSNINRCGVCARVL